MKLEYHQLQKLKNWTHDLGVLQHQPPVKKRIPFYLERRKIGSMEPQIAQLLIEQKLVLEEKNNSIWLNPSYRNYDEGLEKIAHCLAQYGLSGTWRNELLAVTDVEGNPIAKVERAVVRPLGITTHAVYLIGITPDGKFWLQRRSAHKSTNPGKLDTLVSGLVSAGESLMQALIREAKEEAGLILRENTCFKRQGNFITQRPIDQAIGGYMVEHDFWYVIELSESVLLYNEDGEVSGFTCLSPAELIDAISVGELTQESSHIFIKFLSANYQNTP